MSYGEIFTTKPETTDGEILDRVYWLVDKQDLTPEEKVYTIRVTLEYAKETE